jgi:hypothetical protein
VIRRIVLAAFVALALGLGALSFWAPVPSILVIAAVGILVVLATGWVTAGLGRWHEPESEEDFDRVVERAERLARDEADEPATEDWEESEHELFDPWREEDFQGLVRSALDDLLRDFGRDPAQLTAQITRTVRHEIAHHLGWDERGVRELGL